MTGALHDFAMAGISGPADEAEMRARAVAAIPASNSGFGGVASLVIAVAAGPHRQVLRPSEIEADELARTVQQAAMFGADAPLNPDDATQTRVHENRLHLTQQAAEVTVSEDGTVTVKRSLFRDRDRRQTIPSIIEEDVQQNIARALRFTGWLLDVIDPLHRVTDVVPVAVITDTSFTPWRTRSEAAANPSSAMMGQGGSSEPVASNPARRRRDALTHEAERLTEDLTTLLRRARR